MYFPSFFQAKNRAVHYLHYIERYSDHTSECLSFLLNFQAYTCFFICGNMSLWVFLCFSACYYLLSYKYIKCRNEIAFSEKVSNGEIRVGYSSVVTHDGCLGSCRLLCGVCKGIKAKNS